MFDACVYMYMPRHVIQICVVCNSSVSNAMLYPPVNEHPKVVLKSFHGPRVRYVSPLHLYPTVFAFFSGQETLKSFGLSSFGFGGTNTHVSGIAAEKLPETTVAPEVKRGETVREGLVIRILGMEGSHY